MTERKWLIGLLCIGVLAGWILYTRHGDGPDSHMEFPFEASEISGMTLYCPGTYNADREISDGDEAPGRETDVYAARYLTDEHVIQYYYESLSTLLVKKLNERHIRQIESEYYDYGYGPYAEVAFRFELKDGTSFDVIFSAYGHKTGVFRLPDGTRYFSNVDYASRWKSLYERLE